MAAYHLALSVLITWAITANGGRFKATDDLFEDEDDAGGEYCCCKRKKCEANAKSDDKSSDAVYSPNKDLCCKFKSRPCDSWLSFSGYRVAAEESFCKVSEDTGFSGPHPGADGSSHEVVKVEDLTPGSPEHTIHSYCDFASGDGEEEEDSGEASSDAEQPAHQKNAISKAIIQELSKNNLDTMAKEMFSLYVCIRWTPTPAFQSVVAGEIATAQLDNKSVYEHYSDFSFVPMRCSMNVNVYGDKVLGATHFDEFEAKLGALAWWYKNETDGTVNKRLQQVQQSSVADLPSLSGAFDLDRVKRVVAKCSDEDKSKPILVSATKSTTDELLSDCAAAAWWLSKLQDWERALPFMTFMSPDAAARKGTKPKKDEQALICFGKRVASQMHRREKGTHIMTDQSMVGCHGFWDLDTAGKMMERIVQLWRPPTCELQAMELDVKIKLMETIADMNTRLFDALPEMLASEIGGVSGGELGHSLEASPAMGVLKGVWTSIVDGFKRLSGPYRRLGSLLGKTVVKWVVCPVKNSLNATETDLMDMALGTEDDLARTYAETAYSKWTGKQNLLPGEECTPYELQRANSAPRDGIQACSLGIMQEDMPEPYKDEEFLCPVRPLLPSKQQLDIFRKKRDLCLIHMNSEQMLGRDWYYRGSSPFVKQYNVTENLPATDFRYFKLLDFKDYRDEFNRKKTKVTIGNGCTDEEVSLTPRWCKEPNVANDQRSSTLMNGVKVLTGGIVGGAGAVVGAAGLALQAAGVTEKTPRNSMSSDRLGSWLGWKAKSWEHWTKDVADRWFGRAKARYTKMYERHFSVVDTARLLHSASFQSKMSKTGADSKGRQKFDRFSVVVPCMNFDPNYEFRLKYAWSEKAIELAGKAVDKFLSSQLKQDNSRAFRVQLRGEGMLHMKSETAAWMTYSAHIRAASMAGAFPAWLKTKNSHLLELAGVFDTEGSVGADDLLGFEATFACGKRTEMHDLALDFQNDLPGSFQQCVKDGVVDNKAMREQHPEKPFYEAETVVRVTLAPLSSCYVNVDMAKVANVNETKNSVFKTFNGARSSCNSLGSLTAVPKEAGEIPEDLASDAQATDYRGLILGKGLPPDTLMEFLVDPEDFLQEVSL